jgi:hypothetical protein
MATITECATMVETRGHRVEDARKRTYSRAPHHED